MNTKLMRVTFYMRNGATITTENVTNVEMTRNTSDGSYDGYKLEWFPQKSPRLFTLNIPEIIAVVAVDSE